MRVEVLRSWILRLAGKVDRATYQSTTESMQGDFSVIMPFLVKALLENRARYASWAEKMGEEALFEKHPKARGYLRPREGYRLFERRAPSACNVMTVISCATTS